MTDRLRAHQDADVTVYLGDAREVLADLPAASADCYVTSPPTGASATSAYRRRSGVVSAGPLRSRAPGAAWTFRIAPAARCTLSVVSPAIGCRDGQ